MRGERMSWITSFVLAFGYLGRRAVFALPHEVVALAGTTDALSLRLFVTKSEAHRDFGSLYAVVASTSHHGTHGLRNPGMSLTLLRFSVDCNATPPCAAGVTGACFATASIDGVARVILSTHELSQQG